MSFVGKVLVVTNVFLSVCLMIFAGAVATVQTNWKEKFEASQEQIAQLNTNLSENAAAAEDTIGKLQVSLKNAQDAQRRAEGRAGNLDNQLAQVSADAKQSQSQMLAYQTNANVSDTEANVYRNENLNLRAVNEKLHEKRDELFEERNQLERETYRLNRELNRLTDRARILLVENADLRNSFVRLGIDPETILSERGADPIPVYDVDGRVDRVVEQEGTGRVYVQISIGSNDTIKKGFTMYVTRSGDDAKYLGKIKIVDVSPNEAVGRVTELVPNESIEEGDDVTTKI